MDTEPTGQTTDPGAAMLIFGQSVRRGREQDYLAWQGRIRDEASTFPGFRGAETREPSDVQPDWVSIYNFDSVANAQNWLNSSARRELLEQAADIFDGPGTEQVLSQGNQISDPLVTVVVTDRIPDDRVDEFLQWHKTITEAEARFPGFRGSEVFRPIKGVQEEWTTIYRYDTAEHLDAWLNSAERRKLLADSPFPGFGLRTIDESFGNWFTFAGSAGAPPSNFKTSIAVWFGLYPTVVLLTLLSVPLHLPFWLGMLIGNLLSSFVMSYLTMPYYGNRLLRWWLSPPATASQPATNIKGIAFVLAVNAVWALIFYVLTVKLGVAD